MFTGIIQKLAKVMTLSRSGETALLTLDLGQMAAQTRIGDSISINGVCLTVTKQAQASVTFDVSSETLAKSTLGKLTPGKTVNIELPLRVEERFGGHFVLGHADGTAKIKKIEKQDKFATFTFAASKDLLDQMIPKGSVAVDGISLTIAELNPDSFTAAIIPQTLKETTLGQAKINDLVNIEIDIITKTVRRYLQQLTPNKSGLSLEDLKQQGF